MLAPAEIAARLGITEGELCVPTTYEFLADGRRGRPVETADIVVPAAHCEIVYEIPINR